VPPAAGLMEPARDQMHIGSYPLRFCGALSSAARLGDATTPNTDQKYECQEGRAVQLSPSNGGLAQLSPLNRDRRLAGFRYLPTTQELWH
jgi:hypothetical protein